MTDAALEREFDDLLQHMQRFPAVKAPEGLEEQALKSVKQARPVARPLEVAELQITLSCTYCHDRLPRAEAGYCASCLAPHHQDCFASHGGCATPGCEELELVEPKRAATPRPSRRWVRWGLGLALGLGGVAALDSYGTYAKAQRDAAAFAELEAKAEEIDALRAELYAKWEAEEPQAVEGSADPVAPPAEDPQPVGAALDVLHLKNGRSVVGTILSETDEQVTVRTLRGTITIARGVIARIDKQPTAAQLDSDIDLLARQVELQFEFNQLTRRLHELVKDPERAGEDEVLQRARELIDAVPDGAFAELHDQAERLREWLEAYEEGAFDPQPPGGESPE